MKRRKRTKRDQLSTILTFLTETVVEDGDDRGWQLLVSSVGAVTADEFVKHGRMVYREAGAPIFVRGLLTQGGAR